MKLKKPISYSYLLSILIASQLQAQSAFQEGVLIYKADTIRQSTPGAASFIFSQLRVWKKGDLIRYEAIRINLKNRADTIRDIQIRNKQGLYVHIKTPPQPQAFRQLKRSPSALFMPYEEEKEHLAHRALTGTLKQTVHIEESLGKTIFLTLPSEKVRLSDASGKESTEAIFSDALGIPAGVFSELYRKISGTPLQFILDDYGWETRFTLSQIIPQKLPDQLFKLDPGTEVMTMEDVIKQMADFK